MVDDQTRVRNPAVTETATDHKWIGRSSSMTQVISF